jgi:branched-chain amino acid transport system ATP-binding protein
MLDVRHLQAWYGSTQSLFDVTFEVGGGETLALVGTNGAGKSTTLRAIAGLIPSSGDILLEGVNIAGMSAYRRATDCKIAMVHEGRGIFKHLSVEENLLVGRTGMSASEIRREMERALRLFPALKDRLKDKAPDLSGGQQQMVALARAVIRRPKVLMLDEPSLGLAPVLIDEIYEYLFRLKEEGMTMLLVEQDVTRAGGIADRLCFMRTGQTTDLARGDDPEKIRELVELTMGRE